MYARRFLGCVFFLTLLAVAGAFAFYQWGTQALVSQSVPKGHFQAPKAGGAPDYAQNASWISNSELNPLGRGDPSYWLPTGVTQNGLGDASIFYIHPTTYLQRDRWNAPLFPDGETEFRTRLFVQTQASAFNLVGDIWAPRYRQAAFGAFILKSDDAQRALDFAYQDLKAAFFEFLKEAPKKGGIILAGHSQGALHLERLLREEVAGKPIAKRVVAAYVVGWPISTTADLPALGLPACGAPDQAGCILSWMTFAEPANPNFLDEWVKTRGYNGKERRREDMLCVNPISGVQNGAAPPQDNPGTLVPTADMRSASLQPATIGAQCERGLLIIDGNVPPLGPYVMPGNNYHVYDYALFWGAIRRDAANRLFRWNHDHHE